MRRISHVQLLDRGDLAVQQGDSLTLARVARHLGSRVGDPIAEQCEALALSCGNRQSSAAAWQRLRKAIVDRAATAGS